MDRTWTTLRLTNDKGNGSLDTGHRTARRWRDEETKRCTDVDEDALQQRAENGDCVSDLLRLTNYKPNWNQNLTPSRTVVSAVGSPCGDTPSGRFYYYTGRKEGGISRGYGLDTPKISISTLAQYSDFMALAWFLTNRRVLLLKVLATYRKWSTA